MQDENYYIERMNSAEAKFNTLQESVNRIREDARNVLDTFCARKKSDGTFDINFEKFIERLGETGANELRSIIDEFYGKPILHLARKTK